MSEKISYEDRQEMNRTYSDVDRTMFYEGSSDGGFPEANYFYRTFNAFPHHFYNDGEQLITGKFHTWLKAKFKLTEVWSSRYMSGKETIHNNLLYQLNDHKILIKIHAYNQYGNEGDKDIYKDNHHIHVYFDEFNDTVQELINASKKYRAKRKDKGNQISLVITGRDGSLTTKEFDIKIGTINVGQNYGEEFVPIYNKIVKRLNTKGDKGLVLFHGKPGTGKSSLIKFLARNLKKDVLFIPPHMAESISSPSFIPFLSSHPNCVLIIEDAERIISSREAGSYNEGVSNILNISDGILGDCLGIQIIATFNTHKNNIDEALMRKGRLIAEHEFKELPITESNALLKTLGISHETKKPMTLTDIYNLEEEEFKSKETRQSIGFNR